MNAAKSLAEGLRETLTLRVLCRADRLGTSLLTTSGLESVLARSSSARAKWIAGTTSD